MHIEERRISIRYQPKAERDVAAAVIPLLQRKLRMLDDVKFDVFEVYLCVRVLVFEYSCGFIAR